MGVVIRFRVRIEMHCTVVSNAYPKSSLYLTEPTASIPFIGTSFKSILYL